MTEADWDRVFAVDLKGAWLCSKHALVRMKQARRGSIVNIASIHARLTMAGMFPIRGGEVILDVHPMGRLATPAEVANLVAFVASDEASAITGASFAVDCGLGVRFAT